MTPDALDPSSAYLTDDAFPFRSDAENWCALLHPPRASGESCRHGGERAAERDGQRAAVSAVG